MAATGFQIHARVKAGTKVCRENRTGLVSSGCRAVVSVPVLGLLAALASSAVSAANYVYVAEATGQAARQGQVTAGGAVWQCHGNRCAASGPWPVPSVSSCHALAAQIGKIRAYGRKGKMLSPGELGQCNAGLPVAAPVMVPGRTDTATGPGAVKPLGASKPPAPAALTIQTSGITLTGLRWSAPQISTDTINLTGLRWTPVTIDTRTVEMTGLRWTAPQINTNPINLTGLRAGPVVIDTNRIEMTGLRWTAPRIDTPPISMTGLR